jgi:chromosome segregation ATPase
LANKFSNDLPSMAPDRDQVEAYKNKRTVATPAAAGNQTQAENYRPSPEQPQATKGGNTLLALFMIVVAGAAGYSSWWFYQADLKTQAFIKASEMRIVELEKQLSVTGEEMGESTGAMKVRLEKLTKRSEELWIQMDKLWASAWRKNQADIATLNSKVIVQTGKVTKQVKDSTANSLKLKAMGQQQTETEFSLGVLTEQLQSVQNLKAQLTEIENSLATIQSTNLNADKQQIAMASSYTELNTNVKRLIKRLEYLEAKLGTTSATN